MRYSPKLIAYIKHLRFLGSTYREMQEIVGKRIPKATLFHWCRYVPLSPEYEEKIRECNKKSWAKARKVCLENRKIRWVEFNKEITSKNLPIARVIKDAKSAKIALAMLCLGEASKSKNGRATVLSLGNSDPRIITIFMTLMKKCFPVDPRNIRGVVQCRADQNIKELEIYWSNHTKIPLSQFYKASIDMRTLGKPTKKEDYKGVFVVTYLGFGKIQLELESLAQMIYNTFHTMGPVVHR